MANGAVYLWVCLFLIAAGLAAWLWWQGRRTKAELSRSVRAGRDLAEAKAKQEAERMRLAAGLDAVGEACPVGLLLLDAEHRVTWGNRAAWDLFGIVGNSAQPSCQLSRPNRLPSGKPSSP